MLISDDCLDIERVFMDPSDSQSDERRPVLYLLRRDLRDQYGEENDPAGTVKLKSPLLICLGIMIGFELLTKMYSGKGKFNEPGEGTKEVKIFMKDILDLGGQEASALINFRHSLVHSYGLDIGENQILTVDDEITSAHREMSTSNLGNGKQEIYINIWHLKNLFVRAISEYKTRLLADQKLVINFVSCLKNLGEIQIKESVKSRL
ncbi:MAG: hypothetical protein HOC91_16315 [Nitrospinaceae bacterium]|jgi:hypothetical protein|nr:hypothetical protein [Nitrospinaceae bacterium]MBT3820768.1 hypothetical protein [Nitrospinaceae bacterium]MBT4093176.1 hypothetical protein [Nitrospinaceae bacterium]MBT4432074.1 hypothetical protein [Nitrospinaceae bacterium]MBT5367104.1 hypothetical protein [Nitrospinaceae bacterium]